MGNEASYVEPGKEFTRDMNYIPDRITARKGTSADPLDPTATDGGIEVPTWPVEPGRYRLVAAKACPWANRTLIVRNLLGLQDAISVGMRSEERRVGRERRPRWSQERARQEDGGEGE